MISRTSSNLATKPAPRSSERRSSWCGSLLLSATVTMGLVAIPTIAGASTLPAAASTCSKISTGSVAAIVGHPVPPATYSLNKVKPSKADDEISAVVTSCLYGSAKRITALGHDVLIGFEVTSKPLTGSELKHTLSQAEALKFVFKPYSGLGMKAFYYTFTDAGIPIQGIEAINGTTIYAAALYTKVPAAPQLAALVRLAETL